MSIESRAEPRPVAEAVEVEVTLPPLLRQSLPEYEDLRVAGATLGEALDVLRSGHPALRVHLFDERGRTRPHVLIFHNEENVAWLDSLEVPLRPGDRIHVLQAVSGG